MKIFLCFGLSAFLFWNSSFAGEAPLPTTLAELNRWYAEPPAGQNAATKFLEGIAALQLPDADTNSANLPLVGKGALPLPDKPVSPAMKAAMAGLIERNQRAILLFNQGAALQQSRYPIDMSRGLSASLPHLSGIRKAAQILELAAVSHSLAGKSKEAGDDLVMNLALARSLESEPGLVSQLVRAVGGGIFANSLEQTLNRVALPPQTLERLQNSLQEGEAKDAAGFGFNRAFVCERLIGLNLFDMPPEQILKELGVFTPEEITEHAPEVRQNIAADRKLYETTFEQVMAARTATFPARLKQSGIFLGAAKQAADKNYIVSSLMLPSLSKVAAKEAILLANLRLAQTAIALERFRSAHANRYPESLAELTPDYLSAVPADPFDGKALRYHKADKGYVLYSIGMDLRDDAGKRIKGQEGDLVFSVVNPP